MKNNILFHIIHIYILLAFGYVLIKTIKQQKKKPNKQ